MPSRMFCWKQLAARVANARHDELPTTIVMKYVIVIQKRLYFC